MQKNAFISFQKFAPDTKEQSRVEMVPKGNIICQICTTYNVCSTQGFNIYQLPLKLTVLLHVDLINVAYLRACAFIRS